MILRDPVLGVATAVGLALRAWGLGYGLPYVYNPDETAIMYRALALAENGLNPGNFLYPTFYFYVLAGAVGLLAMVRILTGEVASLRAFETRFWTDPSEIFLLGRGLSVLAGTLTIPCVYALGHLVGGRRVARVAAICLAVSYIPIRDAHFVKHDVPVALLVTLAVLAASRVRSIGDRRSTIVAGALSGMAFATHYYAVFGVVSALGARVARRLDEGAGVVGATLDRHVWMLVAAFVTTFACLSPFVLLDAGTALRDIAANRAIVVSRARETFGPFGAGLEHVRLMATQGTGVAYLLAAVGGVMVIVRRQGRTALWVLSFPVLFFAFISNSWPFGRSENPLYPFLAVSAAVCVDALARAFARARVGSSGTAIVVAATALLVAQPLWNAVVMDALMSQTDTRTQALDWIRTHVPDGEAIAVEPYSVPLTPTKGALRENLIATRGSVDRAGYRFRVQLDRPNYPTPSYRLLTIGEGGQDQDKRYVSPEELLASLGEEAAPSSTSRVAYIVLKRFSRDVPNPLGERLGSTATLVQTISPFVDDQGIEAQLPDYDIKPSLHVARPGPIVEIWKTK